MKAMRTLGAVTLLTLGMSACATVPKQAVRDATTSMATQVELAQAALALCRGGDAAQCDQLAHNLENIDSNNQSLASLAQDKK
jgi:starvation-inducible outer membrane lipoprotein